MKMKVYINPNKTSYKYRYYKDNRLYIQRPLHIHCVDTYYELDVPYEIYREESSGYRITDSSQFACFFPKTDILTEKEYHDMKFNSKLDDLIED